MRPAARNVLLATLLAVALVSLIVLVASLQAPVPGGSGEPGDSPGTVGGSGGGMGSGTGAGSGSGSGGGPGRGGGEGVACPEDESSSAPPAAAAAAPAFLVMPFAVAPSRRMRAAGLVGLAALAAGCSGVDPCAGDGGPGRTEVGSRIDSPGGGGGGSGSGTGTGTGTGRGTEPDPPKIDPAALWILLAVVGVLVLAAILFSALSSRKRGKGKGRGAAGEAEAAGAEGAGADDATPGGDAARFLYGMPPGNARTVVAAYVEACQALARAGVERRAWETAREFGPRAPAQARDAMVQLTRLYEAARHGPGEPDDATARQAVALSQRVATAAATEPAGREARPLG